jgi:hypothetical protein
LDRLRASSVDCPAPGRDPRFREKPRGQRRVHQARQDMAAPLFRQRSRGSLIRMRLDLPRQSSVIPPKARSRRSQGRPPKHSGGALAPRERGATRQMLRRGGVPAVPLDAEQRLKGYQGRRTTGNRQQPERKGSADGMPSLSRTAPSASIDPQRQRRPRGARIVERRPSKRSASCASVNSAWRAKSVQLNRAAPSNRWRGSATR